MKKKKENYEYYSHTQVNNLYELVELVNKKYADKIAFSYGFGDYRVSRKYYEFEQDVIALATYFQKHFRGEHIALIGENSYNWIITFLAIGISGNVCVPIDKDYDNELITKLLKQSDAKLMVYSMNYLPNAKDIKIKSIALEDVPSLIREGATYNFHLNIKDNDVCAIFFTSGTTGPNKGVMLTHRSICYDIFAASSLFKPDEKVVSILPYHHAFGYITGVLKPIYYGVEVYINSSLKHVLRDLEDNHPDTLFLVPLFVETFYKEIWRKARKTKKDKKLASAIKLSNGLLKVGIDLRKVLFKDILKSFGGNLKYIICGGAYLDAKYVKWFRSIGIEILNGYGITECSPVVSVNRNLYQRDGSVGQICRGVKVEIINGEVCVSGPIVMNGYYKDKKATSEVLIKGVFHTGDLGHIDKDGFLFITGRIKNLIILSNGENVSPELIEAELSKDEAISEVVVYEKDKKIVASIYPADSYLADQEYFDNLISEYNKTQPVNRQIAYVTLRTTEHIKNSNKKILRGKVEE